MCPSTDATEVQREFAADVLRNLLRRISSGNVNGESRAFVVSHAWTEGPMIYVVFTAPPSDKTWGLARDTRTSIIDPGPWPDVDEAVSSYYLLDFEENWPGGFSRRPGEPDSIQWFGDRDGRLPEYTSEISETHRYESPTGAPSTSAFPSRSAPARRTSPPQSDPAQNNDPRRYADPL
jgi:hypothetical protein